MVKDREKSIDRASLAMLRKADEENWETAWDRFEAMQPQCKFGSEGVCCRICSMGPCRIIPGRTDPLCG
jgi:carbon-monoxide dehydrogenase catalytic subunit